MSDPASDALTDHEVSMLEFAGRRFNQVGAREQAMLDLFGLSAPRFHQQLLVIIRKPAALRHNPVLVNALNREVARKSALRSRSMSARL